MTETGRRVDAGLQLLDRQIIDPNGRLAGKVDDLELTFPVEGDGPPYATAILSGPGALARRLGGRLGSWIESVHSRMHPHEQPGPARVPFAIVKRVNNHVELSIEGEELESHRAERWVREHVIARIPGADDAAE
jgi:hypothetical protein